jgi:hypothetical protein
MGHLQKKSIIVYNTYMLESQAFNARSSYKHLNDSESPAGIHEHPFALLVFC